MKLYGTISSERATKGQGGNKYLEIEILVGNNRDILASFRVEQGNNPDSDLPAYVLINNGTGEVEQWLDIETKGKRQKGERCICKTSNIDRDGLCEECGKYF